MKMKFCLPRSLFSLQLSIQKEKSNLSDFADKLTLYIYNYKQTHEYLCFNDNSVSEKTECTSLITWFCPETKKDNFHWICMGGRKKAQSNRSKPFDLQKRANPKDYLDTPPLCPPCQNNTGTVRCRSVSFLHDSKNVLKGLQKKVL